MPSRKQDAAGIEAFIDALPLRLRLDANRRQWTRFVYHFADIRNVASILARGALCSRETCRAERIDHVDSANADLIDDTPWAHPYARLYFRPRTPTQYHMEGIRPASDRPSGANCPVPVFLLFDSKGMMTREDALFTDSGMNRVGYRSGADLAFLETIRFEDVYHDTWFHPQELRSLEIKRRRHAEIAFPGSVDLEDLREIVCRTGPERDTLLGLVRNHDHDWSPLIRLERPGERLTYKKWLYVEDMQFGDDTVEVRMHLPESPNRSPYIAFVQVWAPGSKEPVISMIKEKPRFEVRNVIRLPDVYQRVRVRIEIDGALAYDGVVSQRTLF